MASIWDTLKQGLRRPGDCFRGHKWTYGDKPEFIGRRAESSATARVAGEYRMRWVIDTYRVVCTCANCGVSEETATREESCGWIVRAEQQGFSTTWEELQKSAGVIQSWTPMVPVTMKIKSSSF